MPKWVFDRTFWQLGSGRRTMGRAGRGKWTHDGRQPMGPKERKEAITIRSPFAYAQLVKRKENNK